MYVPARIARTLLAGLFLNLAPALAPTLAHAQDLDGYARAVDEHPDDAKAYEAYATAAIGARKYDEAITRLKVGIARIPEFRRGYYLLAFAYRSKQAWADAATFYRVCIAIKQQEGEANFGLGKALAGMNDNKSAITAFRRYTELEKDPAKQRFVDLAKQEIAKLEPPAVNANGGAMTSSGGGAMSSGGAQNSGSDGAALKTEGDALKAQGKFEEAAAVYKRALAIDPNNQDLHNELGNAFFMLKRYNEAADAFKAATARDPNYAIAWYNLANALRKGDRRGEAVDAYKHYMALQPNDPDPYFGMGQTLKAMGDSQGAVKAFRRYLEMETRPEQQKWVERARQELTALEAAAPRGASPSAPGGKVGFDDK